MARRYLSGALIALVAAAIITIPSPATAAWLLLAVVCMVVGVAQPVILCYLLVPAVAFNTTFPLSVRSLRAGPADLLVGALALGWIVRRVWAARTGGGFQTTVTVRAVSAAHGWWRRNPMAFILSLALFAYLAVIVLSVLAATNRALVLKEALKWAEVVVVFAVGADAIRARQHRWALVWTMIATGVAEGFFGYAQWVLAAGDLGQNGSGIRVAGTFEQPNPYAAYLNFALLMALAIALFGRSPRYRWLAAGAAVLLSGAQLLANSRGGLLALFAGAVVIVVVGLGIERIAAAITIAGGALVGLAWSVGIVPATAWNKLLARLHLESVSLNGPVNDANFSSIERLAHWVAGIRMYRAHPLLGVGAGNYGAVYTRYAERNWPDALGHAHNYYINAAAETGTFGLITFVVVVGAMLCVAWSAVHVSASPGSAEPSVSAHRSPGWRGSVPGMLARRATRPADGPDSTGAHDRHALALGLLAVVVAVAVHSLVDDVFVHGMELQLALCLALAATMRRDAALPGMDA